MEKTTSTATTETIKASGPQANVVYLTAEPQPNSIRYTVLPHPPTPRNAK
jgi:hypothetical protein